MVTTDGQLLERFAAGREEAAFATLVERHGPMVLGVCRRVLGNDHDAQDAFQATFLVLCRGARHVRRSEAVGGWLYGVAHRVASKLKASLGLRREREREGAAMATDRPGKDLLAALIWRELRPVLDGELSQLPPKYRDPLVLCYLQGKTHEDAARELGWSKGSMSRRVERGKELLRQRLVRRGITLSAGVIFGVLAQNATAATVPPTLMVSTVETAALFAAGRAAAGGVSASVVALAQGVLQAMLMSKLKAALAVAALVGLLGGGVGLVTAERLLADDTPGEGLVQAAAGAGPGDAEPVAQDAKPATPPAQPPIAPDSAPGGVVGDEGPAKSPRLSNQEIRRVLGATSTKFEKGIDPNTPLGDALDFFSKQLGIPFVIDNAAFRRAGFGDDKAQQPVQLAPLRSMTPRFALRQVLTQIEGTYLIKGGSVVIVPADGVAGPEAGEPPADGLAGGRMLREPVHLSVDDKPLAQVLRELAEETGANIVLDVRLKDLAQTPVIAHLQHVPLETVVRLLADMAEVKAVALDNVLYVTTPENAEKLHQENLARLGLTAPESGPPPGMVGGTGLRPAPDGAPAKPGAGPAKPEKDKPKPGST